jgi:protein-S-isoprenylcysteine O-methyltransferase Ste14
VTYLKTLLFLFVVPGTVLFLAPLRLARQTSSRWKLSFGSGRIFALVPWLAGSILFLWSFWNFARIGRGTPHPADPPKELVIQGPYCLTRNPQYVGGVLVLLGHFLWTGAVSLLAYTAAVAAAFNSFVKYYEEPTLERKFGESYRHYRRQVPRWL